MTLFESTTLLSLEFPTCLRDQKSESGLELLTLEFLWPSDLFVYFPKVHRCHTEKKKVLDCVLFHVLSYVLFKYTEQKKKVNTL